ncbi:MAG: LysM protein [Flaviaesturariibacter sp.]|nr:LysM protein [Flaviaesturariibacter sp.]
MKKSLTFLALLFISIASFSQKELLVQGDTNGLHLVHKVAPKEGIYALGRTYGISPKELADYNKLDVNAGLTIGQTILIPLKETNFSQTKNSGTPVYYIVGEKEGLYRVSLKNGKVLMADLRKWNNLSSDAIQTGQKLIVGFLVPSEVSPSVNNVTVTQTPVPAPAKQQEPPIEKALPTETAVSQPVATPKPEKKLETILPPPVATAPIRTAVSDGVGGYFKKDFERQEKVTAAGKDLTVTSGIFKTASGWQDAKYYALVDGVEPGTIVRVINPSNNKVVYAKVLGGMTGIRQNAGYDVRISNAAASILEVKDTDKFVVKVNY